MAEKPASPAPDRRTQGSTSAGRGVLYIAFAKVYFILASAVIELRLPAVLGNTLFGAYKVVASSVSPINNVIITGTIRTVSRAVAQDREHARAIQAAGMRLQIVLGLVIAAAFIGLAPLTARFYHDVDKTGPLMLAGLIIAGYSFYAVFVGTANGLHQFHKQAGLDICFASLRAVGILGMAILGFGAIGAIAGWVGAVVAILIVAAVVIGLPVRTAGAAVPIAPMIRYFAGVAVYLIFLNLVMFVDQILLKRLSSEWFFAHRHALWDAIAQLPAWARSDLGPQGWFVHAFDSLPPWAVAMVRDGIDPARAADGQVGYYAAVQNLARLSYQAIIAATFVVFPLISRSTFDSDREATRRYIHTTLRYATLLAVGIAVVFAANPGPLLDIPYQSDYARMGGDALVALALGNVAFSIFAIAGTMLHGAGLTGRAIIACVATFAVAAAANAIAIPRTVPGPEMLLACAVATASAMGVGAVISGIFLRRSLGAFLPPLTLIRAALAGSVAIFAGRAIPWVSPLGTLAEAAVVGLLFAAMLVVLGELSRRDLALVKSSLSRRRGPS
ncbi:MAG TPA: hypothetical protein VFG83_15555 [Kofleriaceae bacterium]|nr:hypothetical protein [Kofleriaceae bacterium]